MLGKKWYKKLIFYFVALVVAVMPVLAGLSCGGTAKSGGVLKVIRAGTSDVTRIGYPAEGYQPGVGMYLYCAIESLVFIDKEGEVVPHLATGWEITDGGKVYTFTLEEGVKFHDGTDFNAAAVKYNWELFIAEESTWFQNVTSIEVIDEYTVRITFSTPEALFMNSLSYNMTGAMISPTAHADNGSEWCGGNPVGTGPFKYVSKTPDVSLIYEKNDDYWMPGKPLVDGIEFYIYPEVATATAAYLNGDADVLKGFASASVNTILEQSPTTQLNLTAGLLYGWAFDSVHEDSPYSDVRVRRAMAYALDREAIVELAGGGLGVPTDQYCNPAHPAYNSNLDPQYPYDPDMAIELLEEAGYPNGFTTTITPQTSSPTHLSVMMATAMADYYADVGITATVESLDTAQFREYRDNGWTNGLLITHISSDVGSEPWTSLQKYWGDDRYRYTAMEDPPAMTGLLNLIPNTVDPTVRQALLWEVQRVLIEEECSFIPMITYPDPVLYADYVKDMDMSWFNPGHWSTWNVYKET
ncbi:ABC transporter substrate-binding protein [Chloroflexota bacterium]